MPLTRPRRDNPLMARYFREINLPGKQLARRCGVSHSQIFMARNRNVGADNAEKISRGVANILRLSEEDRLLLKAEIMGHPGNLLRAWLGSAADAVRLLDVPEPTVREILDPDMPVTHKSGVRALAKLREMGAPGFVLQSVDRRLMPPPEPRRGLITYRESGPALSERRRRAKEKLQRGKPRTHDAIRRSGLTLKEIHERANVGKETLRKALYGRVGRRSARAIADTLRNETRLSGTAAGAIYGELIRLPEDNS